MFTLHPQPHHIYHPDLGWLDHSHLEALPETAGRHDHAVFVGGPAEGDHPHHIEKAVSTQLEGYTRLSPEEVAALKAEEKRCAAFEAKRRARVEADHEIIRSAARDDPRFAAIARTSASRSARWPATRTSRRTSGPTRSSPSSRHTR